MYILGYTKLERNVIMNESKKNEGVTPMVAKVSQWGNSLGVRIPKSVADRLGLKDGSELNMRLDDNVITLEPVKSRFTLEDLVSQITDENRHLSIDTGEPMGNELI